MKQQKIILIVLLLLWALAFFLFYPFRGVSEAEITPVLEDNIIVSQELIKSPVLPVEIKYNLPKSSNIVIIEEEIIEEDQPEEVKEEELEPISPVTTNIELIVPFTSQAPLANWSDSRQQDGCEEASAIMAIYWARGWELTPQEAEDKILAISDWEQETYGVFHDTSASDTVEWIFKEYFNYEKVKIVNNITIQDIIKELEKGNLVIVPVNGQAIKNRFFQIPGPERHMVVITGYNYQTKEFTTNDPGTKNGHGYVYNENVLFNAIRDYETGDHEPIIGIQKTMIVVTK